MTRLIPRSVELNFELKGRNDFKNRCNKPDKATKDAQLKCYGSCLAHMDGKKIAKKRRTYGIRTHRLQLGGLFQLDRFSRSLLAF